MKTNKELSTEQQEELLKTLKTRFENSKNRHKDIEWDTIEAKLKTNTQKLWSLHQMESTGGEPDVIGYEKDTNEYIFCDCSLESPKDRRSLCYDQAAWDSRKANKPKGNAIELAKKMGIDLLTEAQYQDLQKLGNFDTKTSSWLNTPTEIRKLGGAVFGDFRFDRVFIYRNGVESYYAAIGFRGLLEI